MKNQNLWISTEKKLPALHTPVLVCCQGQPKVFEAWQIETLTDAGKKRIWYSPGTIISRVTHWMPMPNPVR